MQGFYDRKKLWWKEVEDTTLCAACAPPGGGRQEMTPRFVRHFTMLCVPPPSAQVSRATPTSSLSPFPRVFSALGARPGNARARQTHVAHLLSSPPNLL